MIPDNTDVYLCFGAHYIEFSGHVYTSVRCHPWRKSVAFKSIKEIADLPQSRHVGKVSDMLRKPAEHLIEIAKEMGDIKDVSVP